MGIVRIVTTEVTCDICGKWITGRESSKKGMSIDWAKYFARREGATANSNRVVCKECRIKERIERCALIKKKGSPRRPYGKCKGFEKNEKCSNCIANVDFDWEKYINEKTKY